MNRTADQQEILSSWKEIAAYLKRTERTCQRLETGMGLPVHRLDGSPKARVFAYPHELDAWLARKVGENKLAKGKRRPLFFLLPAAVVVAAAALFLVNAFGVRRPERAIAVLLHPSLGQDQGRELPDGIAEDIRNALMQIRGFRVPSRISSSAFDGGALGSREAGRALNVEYVLEIGVQVAGEALRVTAALIDVDDGFQRWANKYDLQIGNINIFDVEDQITRDIVDQLKVKLLAREKIALAKNPTTNPEAYDSYTKGRYLLGQPVVGAPQEALRFFDEALRREPRFALAHVGIGLAYMNMISLMQERGEAAGPKAESASQRALALDPDLPEAHALNAWIQFLYKYDWAAAGKSFKRALELKPGDAITRGMHAYYLMSMKRFEEARREIKLALASDPLTPMLSAYSMWIHLYSGRNEEVLDEFKRIQGTGKSFEFACFGAGSAYLRLGRIDEAVEMFQKGCSLPHSNGRSEAGLAVAYLKRGDRANAEAIYAKLLEDRAKNLGVHPVNLAWVAAALGDIDGAFNWFETAIQERDPGVPAVQVYAEAVLPDIARMPRFRAVLDDLHFPR